MTIKDTFVYYCSTTLQIYEIYYCYVSISVFAGPQKFIALVLFYPTETNSVTDDT